jgi:hypothetical protein
MDSTDETDFLERRFFPPGATGLRWAEGELLPGEFDAARKGGESGQPAMDPGGSSGHKTGIDALVTLFHPRNNQWTDHSRIEADRISGLTSWSLATAIEYGLPQLQIGPGQDLQ